MSIAEPLEAPNELLDAALFYASKGWPVLPLHTPDANGRCDCRKDTCTDIGKHPRTRNGSKDATTDEFAIRRWWAMWPQANIGIAMGNGRVVIDVDVRQGGVENWHELLDQHDAIPSTPESITGSGGRHVLFYSETPIKNSVGNAATGIAPGIDVRSDGGYIVAPPSLHGSGRRYEWECSSDPSDIQLAMIPEWLAALAGTKPSNPHKTSIPVSDVITKGSRDTILFTAGCSLRAKGLNYDEILAALLVMNRNRCQPPLDEIAVEQKAKQAAKYDCGTIHGRHAAEPSNDGPSDGGSDDNGRSYVLARGDHSELATELLLDLQENSSQEIVYALRDFYRYNDATGIWDKIDENHTRCVVSRYTGRPVATAKGTRELKVSDSDISGTVKIAGSLAAERTSAWFDSPTDGIAFANGFVTVAGGKIHLLGHSPDHRATTGMPFDYEKNRPHPRWSQYLEEVFANASEEDRADRIALLQEFSGACLTGMATSFAKCLILQGAGQNGKSVFLSVINALFPANAKAAIPPTEWNNRFTLGGLANKRINLVNELREAEIIAPDNLKSVISGDPTHADRKHKDSFTFVPRAGHLFSANRLPSTSDQTDGFWRRFMVVCFDRRFSDEERVRDIDGQIIRAELQAIASWALEGAARLQRQDAYTVPETSRAAKQEWRETVDQVLQFVDERCQIDPSADTTLDKIYSAYVGWAKSAGHQRPLAKAALGLRLKTICQYKRSSKSRSYGLTVQKVEPWERGDWQ